MKGLIRNNMYSMMSNIKIALCISLALCITPFLVDDINLITMVIGAQSILYVANVGTSLQADETAKWTRFECTLPVSKRTIIAAKYISLCSLILLGFVVSLFTGLMAVFSGKQIAVDRMVWSYGYGFTIACVVVAVSYPIILKIGAEKSELVIVASAAMAVVFMLLVAVAAAPFTGGMQFQSAAISIVSACLSPFLILISAAVSLRIYEKKQF